MKPRSKSSRKEAARITLAAVIVMLMCPPRGDDGRILQYELRAWQDLQQTMARKYSDGCAPPTGAKYYTLKQVLSFED
jgi:hypothetical protein